MSDEYRNKIVDRISECEVVLNDLESSPAWKVITADMERQRKQLDDNWHNIIDEVKLQRARELKTAVMHILSIKDKYREEITALKKELDMIDNPDKEVAKDYDNETNVE